MKKNLKKTMKIAALYVASAVLFFQGGGLCLYMWFSTFMPCNPWRKLFYLVAGIDVAIAIFLFLAANAAVEILKKKKTGLK